ncbi:hypothetical protein DMC30DRAFT_389847 [Rhodotorula diobovata]|uniref:Uncharacterized protein n=1 Tax=Rhodotorula diobovata TaxID=5288 RepID=A0A5C5G2L2_9BASI|nr:hypothetical protein DMC30DRAFT_389847 [Rhodotorula diobovata]
MPSLKACFAAFALAALAFSPVARAGGLDGSDLVQQSPSQPSLLFDATPVDLRPSEARANSAARVKRARLAAAKQAKRGLSSPASHDASHALLKRHLEETYAREGVTKGILRRRAIFARRLKRYRCARDRVCAQAVTDPSDIPVNGAAVCNPQTHLCQVGCQPGFFLTGGVCVQSASTCGPNTCGTTSNGAFLCAGGNVCTLVCDTINGFVATPQNTCVNLVTSEDNCGAIGNVCPPSYNGIGSPWCRSRQCGLRCPPGYYSKRTQDGQFLFCYGS